jgi:hypothetical protein
MKKKHNLNQKYLEIKFLYVTLQALKNKRKEN